MQTTPVIDLYRRFGKVREVSGEFDELTVYENTRKAMLPQVSFIIGPQASGKTTLGAALCERTNQRHINFNEFCKENKLDGKNEETVVMHLINSLSNELASSVLIEDFPKTEFQAKFFIKNCVAPFRVFALKCSKDTC
jgi:adenylate kinase family enzyme